MINNIQNTNNLPQISKVVDKKPSVDAQDSPALREDSVELSNHNNYTPVSDPIQVNTPGLLSPLSKKTTASIFEKTTQNGVDSLSKNLISNPKTAKTVAKVAGAIPSGFAYSVGQVVDTALNNVDALQKNTSIRLGNIKEKYNDPSTQGLKTGLAVTGSILGGIVGTAADLVATGLDMKSATTGVLKRTVFNAVDTLEGTKQKTLPKTHSTARKVDVKIQKLTDSIQKGHGVVAGTALGLSVAVGGALAETVSECVDMSKMIYERMEKRASAKGVNYSAQKEQAWNKYETSDKGFTDKAKLFGSRFTQEAKKITDVRVGDVLRTADTVLKVPKRMAINTARNIGDVFK